MYKGTTPVLTFHIKNEKFNMAWIDVCHITIESKLGLQRKVYENPEINIKDKTLRIYMTQEDTNIFSAGKIKIQLKIKLTSGSVVSSGEFCLRLNDILEEEEI